MKRHSLFTRVWHWVNAAAIVVLFMSGLGISNAHRFLYWGNYGFDPADAWMQVMRFPSWTTLPSTYNLAASRDWHILAAWPFAIGLLGIWVALLVSGRFRREVSASAKEWNPKAIAAEVATHLKGKFDSDCDAYNPLQKIAYGVVYGVFLPMMVFTGLAISPGFEPAAPWLVDILGGRQSARSLHFIFAFALLGFFVIHMAMLIVSGPVKRTWGMITGGKLQDTDNG